MKVSQKAGLALALAAIFTTGGASAALAADNVTVSSGGQVSGTTADSQLVVTGGGANPAVEGNNQTVGNVVVNNGATDFTVKTTPLTIAGNGGQLVATEGGTAIPVIIGGSGGGLILSGGSGQIDTLQFDAADSTLEVGDGQYSVKTLDTKGTKVTTPITVGNATQSGELNITGNADLSGSTIFADPAWRDGQSNPLDPSRIAVNNFAVATPNEISSILVAGRNSQIIIGQPDSTWMQQAVNSTGWWQNDGSMVKAAVGAYRPFTITDGAGALTANGWLVDSATDTLPDGTAAVGLAADSLFVANMVGGQPVLTGTGAETAIIGANPQAGAGEAGAPADTTGVPNATGPAYLYLVNATAGQNTVLSNFGTITVNNGSWSGDYLKFDNILLSGTGAVAGTDFNVTATANNARSVLPKLSKDMATTINTFMANGMNNTEADQYDVRFISRALSRMYGAGDAKGAITTIEGFGAAAAVAGVPYSSFNISNTVADLVNGRAATLGRVAVPAGGQPGEVGLWLKPFYSYSKVDGLKVGKYGNKFELNYGGAVLGIDTNINEYFNLGLAFNAGGGDSDSKGDFAKTESEFDFWGLSLYGNYTYGDFGLIMDVGFQEASHDLKQKPGMGMAHLKGDVDTTAFTLGLTAEYVFDTGWGVNLAPHLGFRYNSLKIDDYHMKAAGQRVVKSSAERQNLWTIPIGLTVSQDYLTQTGWEISPVMDLGLIVAAGDTSIDNQYRFANFGSGKIESEVVDDVTFNGMLGIKAKAPNGLSLGLDYNLRASENLNSHSFAGMLRYEF